MNSFEVWLQQQLIELYTPPTQQISVKQGRKVKHVKKSQQYKPTTTTTMDSLIEQLNCMTLADEHRRPTSKDYESIQPQWINNEERSEYFLKSFKLYVQNKRINTSEGILTLLFEKYFTQQEVQHLSNQLLGNQFGNAGTFIQQSEGQLNSDQNQLYLQTDNPTTQSIDNEKCINKLSQHLARILQI